MNKQQAKKRISILHNELNQHNHAYYNQAEPTISDREYDRLHKELVDLEIEFPELITNNSPTQRVGAEPLLGFATKPHTIPMLSLGNTYNKGELANFNKRIHDRIGNASVSFIVEPKIDGVSISLRYENGILVQALTRGNGKEGDDVTQNVRTIKSIPLKLNSHKPPEILEARGEIFMTTEGFDKSNKQRLLDGKKEFANARNATAGTIKLLDSNTVAKRPLDARFYTQGEIIGIEINSQKELLKCFQDFGLPVQNITNKIDDFNDMWQAVEDIADSAKKLPYEIDGAVIKVNEFKLRKKIGFTAKAPSWAISYKYETEKATTILNDITIQVGRTGNLTPVAELEPVALAGSTISRATLHNEDEIHRKDIRIGDTVIIEKAGEVIPAVVKVVLEKRPLNSQPFNFCDAIDNKCPSCGEAISREENMAAWCCSNLQCPAQSMRRIEHFAGRNALDIDRLGGIVAEKIIETELVKEPLDLFSLTISKLGSLNLGTTINPRTFGEKNAAKIIKSLEKAKSLPLSRWLFSLGISNIGATTAYHIAQIVEDIDKVNNPPQLLRICQLEDKKEEKKLLNPKSRTSQKNLPDNIKDMLPETRKVAYDNISTEIKELTILCEKDNLKGKIGPVAAKSFINFFSGKIGQKIVSRLKELNIKPCEKVANSANNANAIAGKSFVITGTLQTMGRSEASEKIRAMNGKISGSVSKKTDFVIAGENPGGSKYSKAEKLGITIISEDEFTAMLTSTKEEKQSIKPSKKENDFSDLPLFS